MPVPTKQGGCLRSAPAMRSIEAADAALQAARSASGPGDVQVFARISDPQLRIHRAAYALSKRTRGRPILDVFDPFDVAARIVVQQRGGFLDRAAELARPPRAVVGGLGPIGEAVALHLARAWQRGWGKPEHKLELTLVDPDASIAKETLRASYPELDNLCNLDARDYSLSSPEWLRGEPLGANSGDALADACFLCATEEDAVISPALSAHYLLRGSGTTITICVMQTSGTGAAIFDDLKAEPLPPIYSVIDEACAPEIVLGGTRELLARATHDNYVRQQLAAGETVTTNPSMVPWDELPEDLRESNRAQADHTSAKLAELGCAIVPAVFQGHRQQIQLSEEEIEHLSEAEHERWVAERTEAGWIYGPAKDIERKTNPSVPWNQLPEPEKEKDRATVRNLPHRLELAGFALVRS